MALKPSLGMEKGFWSFANPPCACANAASSGSSDIYEKRMVKRSDKPRATTKERRKVQVSLKGEQASIIVERK